MTNVNQLLEMVKEINSWDNGLAYLDFKDMDELNDILCGLEPTQILNMAYFGDFRPIDPYFIFNGSGNIVSYTTYDMEKELKDNESDIINTFKEYVENGYIESL